MSVEVVPGGQRRIDRVLHPGLTDGVDRPGLPELHVEALRGARLRSG